MNFYYGSFAKGYLLESKQKVKIGIVCSLADS